MRSDFASFRDRWSLRLVSAVWPDGIAWKASLGALRIQTVNHEGKPAVGSVVALAATDYFGIADSKGLVEIRNLPPGLYAVRIIDPQVAELGVGLPTLLRFVAARDTTSLARLMVPTAKQFAIERCRAAGQRTFGGAALSVLDRIVTLRGEARKDARSTVATRIAVSQRRRLEPRLAQGLLDDRLGRTIPGVPQLGPAA
jgi:hypothetical protein